MIGNQSTLAFGTPGSEQTINDVISIDPPKDEADDIDITTLSSAAYEYEPGLRKLGTMTFEAIYSTTLHGALDAGKDSTLSWKITLPDSGTITFLGYIKSVEKKVTNPDLLKLVVTVMATGAIDVN